jgi:hypothetical protein
MPLTRRRRRRPDPLASAEAVRAVLRELAERLPNKPKAEREIVSLLRAAIHAERSPAPATKAGRRSKWPARELALAASLLREILARETSGRKDARTFVDHYLRVIAFPADVLEAFERGDANLFEAEQLARLTSKTLGVPPAKAAARRQQVLRAHLRAQESSARLRSRVGALLAAPAKASDSREAASPGFSVEVLEAAADLEAELDGEPEALVVDPTGVFYDLLSALAYALSEIDPAELTDDDQERIFEHGDKVLLVLNRVKARRARTKLGA